MRNLAKNLIRHKIFRYTAICYLKFLVKNLQVSQLINPLVLTYFYGNTMNFETKRLMSLRGFYIAEW